MPYLLFRYHTMRGGQTQDFRAQGGAGRNKNAAKRTDSEKMPCNFPAMCYNNPCKQKEIWAIRSAGSAAHRFTYPQKLHTGD